MPSMRIAALLLLVGTNGFAQPEKPTVLYVVTTGGAFCPTLSLFSGPGFPKDINSFKTAEVRSGDSATILEVSKGTKDSYVWYRVRLEDGKTGWITESCSGSRLQVGGEHPAVNLTLVTASGRKLRGYLRKRSRTDGEQADEDLGLVRPSDSMEVQDAELGRIRIPWRRFLRLPSPQADLLFRRQEVAPIKRGPSGLRGPRSRSSPALRRTETWEWRSASG